MSWAQAPFITLAALLSLAPLTARAQAPAKAKAGPIALVGATVHPIDGPDLAEATVIVENGKIRAIQAGRITPPAGTTMIDLKGKHLYPGLVDANTVLGLAEISSVKGTEDTREVGQINPNLRAELAVNPDSTLLPVARTGGVLFAHIVGRSGLISGTSAVIHTAGWTWESMTVRAPVFLHVRWPTMRINPRGQGKNAPKKQIEKREKAIAALRGAFKNARAYWKAQETPGANRPDEDGKWEAMRKVVRGVSGVDSDGEAGGSALQGMRVAVEADDLTQIEAALDWAREERVSIVIVGGADAWRVAKKLKYADVPVILGKVNRLPLRAYESLHTPYQNASLLHAAGVKIAFGTGGSGFQAANSRNLTRQVAHAIGHGLPRQAGLHALTLGAASILGVDRRLGSITAGKEATLIATDRPLFDFRCKVVKAWISGKAVSLRDRQLKLYERYKAKPRR